MGSLKRAGIKDSEVAEGLPSIGVLNLGRAGSTSAEWCNLRRRGLGLWGRRRLQASLANSSPVRGYGLLDMGCRKRNVG